MFSACQALKMHLSDDTALSSRELVCFVFFKYSMCQMKLTVCMCACACACMCFNSMSLDGCGEDAEAEAGCVQVRPLKRNDFGNGHNKPRNVSTL